MYTVCATRVGDMVQCITLPEFHYHLSQDFCFRSKLILSYCCCETPLVLAWCVVSHQDRADNNAVGHVTRPGSCSYKVTRSRDAELCGGRNDDNGDNDDGG